MKWKGTVSQSGNTSMAARFRPEKTIQAMSTQCRPKRPSTVSGCIDAVSLAPDGDDRPRAELRAEPPDVDVDHVRLGLEVIPPDRRQEPFLGHGSPRVSHQLAKQ